MYGVFRRYHPYDVFPRRRRFPTVPAATPAAELNPPRVRICYLVEISPKERGGSVATFNYSDVGYTSPPIGTNTNIHFEARARQPLRLNRTLPVAPELGRRVATEIAGIELNNEDGGLDDLVLDYAIDGRRIRVLVGETDDQYDNFVPIFAGRGVDWFGDLRTVTINARDEAHRLDIPFQADLYEGTGGIEGTEELKGKCRPVTFGQCPNVLLELIDPTNLVYQFHHRQAQSVDAVYDRGAALTPTADQANYADLIATVLSAGQYATCLALGLVRLETTPTGLVTADVKGDASGSYIDTTFPIAQRILTDYAGISTAEIETLAFAAMGAEVTGVIGWHQGLDSITCEQAMSEIVGHCAAWWGGTPTGPFTVGRVEEPDPAEVSLSLGMIDILDAEIIPAPPGAFPPRFRQRVAYNNNWTVQRGEDLAASVSAARRLQLAEPHSIATAEDLTTQDDFALAQDPDPLQSLFVNSADAEAEAQRLIDLLSVPRTTVLVPLKDGGYDAPLGATVDLTTPRINDGLIWYARVIGHEVDAGDNRVNLILWG